MKRIVLGGLLGIVAWGTIACSAPFYTWQYDHAANPVATSAYIRAVMAAEAGSYETALYYYDIALSREYSPRVKAERDAVAQRIANDR